MTTSATDNELIAGKLWFDSRFPDATTHDLLMLKEKYKIPFYAEVFLKKKWFHDTTLKKPFFNSQIYRKDPHHSSSQHSSLYTLKSESSSEVD